MILTDYYRLADLKSASGNTNKSHRLDCTASTGGYARKGMCKMILADYYRLDCTASAGGYARKGGAR